MAFCSINNPPRYTVDVERWDRETYADGGEMAVPIEQLLNNTYYNKVTLERHELPIEVTLLAAGWSDEAPYLQRVPVPGIKASDNPLIGPCTPKGLDAADVKLRKKMAALITDGETEDGYATFYCGVKRPTTDFTVYLRGVSGNG